MKSPDFEQALAQILIQHWEAAGEPNKALPATVELLASAISVLFEGLSPYQRTTLIALLSDRLQSYP